MLSLERVVRKVMEEVSDNLAIAVCDWQNEFREKQRKEEKALDLWLVLSSDDREFKIEAEGWRENISGESIALEFYDGEKTVGTFKKWKHVRKASKSGYRDF